MAVPISNVTRRAVYAPSGAGGVGPYAFTFEILANTDIAVFKDNTLLTLTTHYTVTINANGTGSVTITAAGLALSPTSPTQYAIVGNRTIARATDFTTGGDFFANTINDELDQQTIFAQQNAEGLNRALQAPQTDPTTINMTLPAKATRIGKYLAFDSNGNPVAGPTSQDVGTVAGIASDITTVSGIAANVTTVAGISGNVTTVAGISSAVSTVATNNTNVSTVATNIASVNTNATNIVAIQNASANATAAASSATAAAGSATAAAGSATSAANSAAAAASALDSFDDRYLGTKTSDPTLDNDGNALVAGALYFSTTQNVMKVYDGASWITATSAGATSLLRFRYVATSGQTTFSGADAAAATLTYTVNNIAVHRNGVTLDTSEYTASNGTSIVLTVAAGTGDIVDIIAFKSFTVADALSAVSGGTVNGAVTITGVTTVQAGTVSAPAITTTGDTNTGIFFPAADTIAFAEGGVESMRIDSSGNVGIGTSSPTLAKLQIAQSSSSAGAIYSVAASGQNGNAYIFAISGVTNGYRITNDGSNNIQHVWDGTGGAERARIDSSGNLLVGATAKPTTNFYGLYVKSSTTASSDWAFYVDNSAANTILRLRNDGYLNSPSTYNNTTAAAANMYIDSAGYIYRSTSSLKYKTDIQNATHGLTDLMKLRSVTYKQKTEDAENGVPPIVFGGLIAEEVHDAGLTEFVQYADDGSPDALAYGNMVSLCIKAIQEQQAIITQLQADVAALKGNA
jgi:hypothetical protein